MARLFLVTGIPAAGKSTVSHALARRFEETPRVGLWLDTSSQSAEDTVEEILKRLGDSVISSSHTARNR